MSGQRLEELVQESGEAGELQDNATKKEEELCKREQALQKPDKRIRASAAGSSSPPRQPPPPGLTTHVHQLPDEVLAEIFALLSLRTIVRALSVCRRWWDVIEDRYLNKKLVFKHDEVTTEEALCLIHSAQGLKSLELIWRSDTVALLDAASDTCRNLLQLSVDGYMDDASSFINALRRVFQVSPHITDLRLTPSVNHMFYQDLGGLLPNLRKLELDIFQLSDRPVGALLDSCSRSQMQEFMVRFCPCSDEHIAKLVQFWGRPLRVLELVAFNLTDGALARLVGCSELRRLGLFWLSTPGAWLCGLVALSHLEDLNLTFVCEVEQGNLCRFFSQSRSNHILRKLSLEGCSGVGDRVLASVAASCPQLEELNVERTQVTICGVREVLGCCHKLHTLIVEDTDASVTHIVLELPQLAPQLRRICIGHVDEATRSLVEAQMPHLRIR